MRKFLMLVAAFAAVALAACSGGAEAGDVTFDVEAIEIKGATDGIDPPSTDPTDLSLGYRYTPPGGVEPDNPAKWQVSTYMFAPGAMAVVKGDDVTLRFFGVNGDAHEMWVEDPDGNRVTDVVTLNRGRELKLDFTADKTGHYKVICATHAPTMQADILSVSG